MPDIITNRREKKKEGNEIGKIARMDEYFVKRKKGGRRERKGNTVWARIETRGS